MVLGLILNPANLSLGGAGTNGPLPLSGSS